MSPTPQNHLSVRKLFAIISGLTAVVLVGMWVWILIAGAPSSAGDDFETVGAHQFGTS